jgi:tRNA(fMet)-specific endonuclease VapC
MFVVFDTNHYREVVHQTLLFERLDRRMTAARADAFTTIVTVQEITQGWAAEINRRKAGREQLKAYRQFQNAIGAFCDITILPFDEEAVEEFHRLQTLRLKVGTMDLKIAAIAISHSALLLSRNLLDFRKVPGLRVENWLD